MTSLAHNDFSKFAANIATCLTDSRWYLSSQYELKISGMHTDTRSTDSDVVVRFLDLFRAKASALDLPQRAKISSDIKCYIEKSQEIGSDQKNTFLGKIEAILLRCIVPESGAVKFLYEYLYSLRTQKKPLSKESLAQATLCLTIFAREQLDAFVYSCSLVLDSFSSYITEQRKLLGAREIQLRNKQAFFIYEPTEIDLQSAEEFAILSSIRKDIIHCSSEQIRQKVVQILTREPTYCGLKIIKHAKYELASRFLDELYKFLLSFPTKMPITIVPSLVSKEMVDFNKSASSDSETATPETSKILAKAINNVRQRQELASIFYKNCFTSLQKDGADTCKKGLKTAKGYCLPAPEELYSVKIPDLSYEMLEPLVKKNAEAFLDALLQQEGSFSTFFGYFLQPDEVKLLQARYNDFLSIDSTMASLSLAERPTRKKKQKARAITHPEPAAEEPSSETSLPTASPIIKQQPSVYPKITTAPRVRDWLKRTPAILQSERYQNLCHDEQEKVRMCHCYPIVITHLLREHGKKENWTSTGSKKASTLYSSAGYIIYNGQRINGYYADCFDGPTLYHHYFHETAFHELVERYGEIHSFVNSSDRASIEKSYEPKDEVEEIEVHGQYEVLKRSFSIEVVDRSKNITYCICFPEGL